MSTPDRAAEVFPRRVGLGLRTGSRGGYLVRRRATMAVPNFSSSTYAR